MINDTIIDNVEPFNEIFYKICFNNSFIPVIRFLGKSELPFLINDIIVYKLEDDEKWNQFGVEYISHNYFEDVLKDEGIEFETKENCDNIVEDTCRAINRGRPVIIWIDCFYDPLRNDTYHKKHMVHTLLIYGYNKEERIFHIVEHKYQHSLSYAKNTISFSDLTNCYEGQLVNVYKCGVPNFNACERKCGYPHSSDYRNNCGFLKYANLKNRNNFPNYYEFYINTDSNNIAAQEVKTNNFNNYCKNLIKSKEIILAGLDRLGIFVSQVEIVLASEDELSKNSEVLLNITNEIMNAKLAEKFKITQMEGINKELLFILDKTIAALSYVRNNIVKYMYSLVYHQEKMQEINERLNNVLKNEDYYYQRLYSFIETHVE